MDEKSTGSQEDSQQHYSQMMVARAKAKGHPQGLMSGPGLQQQIPQHGSPMMGGGMQEPGAGPSPFPGNPQAGPNAPGDNRHMQDMYSQQQQQQHAGGMGKFYVRYYIGIATGPP